MAKQPKQQEEGASREKPKVSRSEAAARVVTELDGEVSLAELVAKADALVVEGGGKSDPDRVETDVWRLACAAEELGLVEVSYLVRRKEAKS